MAKRKMTKEKTFFDNKIFYILNVAMITSGGFRGGVRGVRPPPPPP